MLSNANAKQVYGSTLVYKCGKKKEKDKKAKCGQSSLQWQWAIPHLQTEIESFTIPLAELMVQYSPTTK